MGGIGKKMVVQAGLGQEVGESGMGDPTEIIN
jgi:hypothetical protein